MIIITIALSIPATGKATVMAFENAAGPTAEESLESDLLTEMISRHIVERAKTKKGAVLKFGPASNSGFAE